MRKTLLASTTACLLLLVPVAQAGSPTRVGVSVKDFSYSPSTVIVKKGGTVVWTWRGRSPHDVNGGRNFRSTIRTSGSWSHRFTRTGTFSYYCTIHASMRGKVVVRSS